jgi:hypothetical protein
LSSLIYLETNWIIGAVMGQDLRADDLLSAPAAQIQLAMPSVCLMEAISAFDWKRIERNRLKEELDKQLVQVERSKGVAAAQQLTAQLIEAKTTNDRFLSDLLQRLDDYLVRVAQQTVLLPPTTDIVQHMTELVRDAELDRDDAFILASILAHVPGSTVTKKAFLTGNFRDFGKEPVKKLLAAANVELLISTERALGWAAA